MTTEEKMTARRTIAEYQADRHRQIKAGTWESRTISSTPKWLTSFQLGEVRWVTTTLETYAAEQRQCNLPVSRRPAQIKGWVFRTALFTAVSASRAGDIAYLIRVERVA